jgi:hypothetical protein
VLQLCVVLPLAQVNAAPEGWGLCEDSWDSLVMIGSRPLLQLLLLAYTGSLAAYNICGMVTTGEFNLACGAVTGVSSPASMRGVEHMCTCLLSSRW